MTVDSNLYEKHIKNKLDLYVELMEQQGFDGLVIPSGVPKMQFLDDNPYPFKVNVHFKALIPVDDVPYSYIIIIPEDKPVLVFYQPEDYWHVVPSDPAGVWVDSFDIKVINDRDRWLEFLPNKGQGFAWLGDSQRELSVLSMKAVNPDPLLNAIHYHRAYKNDYEVACLKLANIKAAKGHIAAKEKFYEGGSELEIHLAYLKASQQKEEQLPYGNIIALNSHGSVLHYTELSTVRHTEQQSFSFLLDGGATYNGYCSDITRTWAFQEGEFKDLIDQFDLLQKSLVSQLAPNTSYVSLHIKTHLKIAEFLKQADFIYCTAQEALATGISSAFYPHGLGHLLGLQVHDIGGYQVNIDGTLLDPPEEHPFLRLTKTLESGFCVTMEPGVYFIELLLKKLKASKHASQINWSKVEAFKQYGGIRIEDDVIIRNEGVENLTRNAFLEISQK